MKPTPPTHKKRPMALRYETQRQWIARLLLLGWTSERIAKRLHISSRTVRYWIGTPEFQTLFAELQRDQLTRIDRKLSRLLHAAIAALARLLTHRDWRARDAAVEKILRLHGPALERIILRIHEDGRPASPGAPVGLPPMDDWTPDQRAAARVVLQAMQPRQLPPRPRYVVGERDDPLDQP